MTLHSLYFIVKLRFVIKVILYGIVICTAPDTFYQYPGPVFGAGAVFRDIASFARWSRTRLGRVNVIE